MYSLIDSVALQPATDNAQKAFVAVGVHRLVAVGTGDGSGKCGGIPLNVWSGEYLAAMRASDNDGSSYHNYSSV